MKQPKEYKVWIEVEEFNPKTGNYEKVGEPLDIECPNEATAHKLQTTLHEIGEDINRHFPCGLFDLFIE